jgi:hypothetical protein
MLNAKCADDVSIPVIQPEQNSVVMHVHYDFDDECIGSKSAKFQQKHMKQKKNRPSLRIHDTKRIAIKEDGTQLPVVDSKFTFLVTPNEEDIKNGIPGDHAQCMYCLACKRMHGSSLVWVTRGLAYVELKDGKGKSALHRFILGNLARFKISDFDASRYVPAHSVMFMAPRGKQTLDAKNKIYRERVEDLKSGKVFPKKAHVVGKKQDHTAHPLESATLRDKATGLFQFKIHREHHVNIGHQSE